MNIKQITDEAEKLITEDMQKAIKAYSVSPDVIQSFFRGQASVMVIGEINNGNPAFKDWSMRLSCDEKLPRGKFFHKEERIRALLNTRIGQTKYTTIHAS
ncbi:TPA: hypothetical protein H1U34_004494 [Salmonella enterica]|nr:hypothetical protein [Salmonella enterica]